MRCADYKSHYSIDAHDMALLHDLGHFQQSAEIRRMQAIARRLRRKSLSKVLDMGCGSGGLSQILSAEGKEVVACDIGWDSLKRAHTFLRDQRPHISFVHGDIYNIPLGSGCMDAAVASEVIEHLDDPKAAVSELARVVRPGGTVVISTPYKEKIQETLCIYCNKHTPVNAHLHIFDEASAAELFLKCGLRPTGFQKLLSRPLERMGLAGFSSFLPYWLWRASDRLGCLTLGRQAFMIATPVRAT